jgi:hypothetical protein
LSVLFVGPFMIVSPSNPFYCLFAVRQCRSSLLDKMGRSRQASSRSRISQKACTQRWAPERIYGPNKCHSNRTSGTDACARRPIMRMHATLAFVIVISQSITARQYYGLMFGVVNSHSFARSLPHTFWCHAFPGTEL